MKITNRALPKLAQLIAALLISLIFVELGIWQLHRAEEVRVASRTLPDKPLIALTKIATPGRNLTPGSVNRIVRFRGHYGKTFTAPNQGIGSGSRKERVTLEVRILEVDSGGAILVVRGVAGAQSESNIDEVVVTGRLYPHQNSDVILPSGTESGILSRVDPALIAGQTKLNLYDGYVVARSERTSLGQEISAERIASPQLKPRATGYYWQHLTYLVIWWLLALLVLVAPFYNRLKESGIKAQYPSANGDFGDKVRR